MSDVSHSQLEEYNALYDFLLDSARRYAIKSLPSDVAQKISEYNTAKCKWDKFYYFYKHIVARRLREEFFGGVWGVVAEQSIPDYLDSSDNSPEDIFPLVAKGIFKHMSIWRRLLEGIKIILGKDNIFSRVYAEAYLYYLFRHSEDSLNILNSYKKCVRDKRDSVMDALGPFGVVPSGNSDNIMDFISYGNIVESIAKFPDSFQMAVKPQLDRFKELKINLGL